MQKLVEGIDYEVNTEQKTVTLVFSYAGRGEPSGSGKSLVLASTRGNIVVPGTDGGQLGLNFYRKK